MAELTKDQMIALTAHVVGAYVGNNRVPVVDLPGLVKSVYSALALTAVPPPSEAAAPVEKATASQIRKSITPDALISFEDGRPYKTLKRHLTNLGLTIPEYKAKWGLPQDYPTTAPSYSQARSMMAKALGLGQGGRKSPKRAK
ncbi:MucR family transcriptional regulator [Caulobacter sp. DWR1-3-2b1]|uniref:MucR family transcriptional regulator n=1 Tax=Caulobacter sp. DWR1-3-2b1 TaxID=2804670 RepID=UPI003CFA39BD